jgi:hypothetical protein
MEWLDPIYNGHWIPYQISSWRLICFRTHLAIRLLWIERILLINPEVLAAPCGFEVSRRARN